MYEVRVKHRVLKDIEKLPEPFPLRISQLIDALADNPRPPGAKKLRGVGDYRLRAGTYRVLYEVDDEASVVTVYRVKHRREAYR